MMVSNEKIPVNICKKLDIKEELFTEPSDSLACRDPFIMLFGDYYFLYKRGENQICCQMSRDLKRWTKPVAVYTPPKDFHGEKDLFWAPECHYYNGYFYIFTSVFSKNYQRRMISVYRADNPLGPFEDIAGGHITPEDWDAIDGTLYIDEDNNPWMVFVHEWVTMPEQNGAMVAARLSEDFTHFISEPIQLFLAKEPKWATKGVTDGPYMYRTKDKLFMIWSNFSEKGYVVSVSESLNGKIDGKWLHREELLYEKNLKPEYTVDGGHAMIFIDKKNETRIVMHGPNNPKGDEFEHILFFTLLEKNGTIYIK